MTDGRIARLAATATVIAGQRDQARLAALAEGLLRTGLPAALPEALDAAFADDPAVYVARSVRCQVSAGLATTNASLARAVAAGLVRAVRDPEACADEVARFPSIADYHAAFLAAMVSGDAAQHWQFAPLRHLSVLTPSAAFRALAAERHDMTGVLLAAHRAGQLGRVTAAAGEQALAESWPRAIPGRHGLGEWLSITRLAFDLARALGWPITSGQDARAAATTLAQRAETGIDWTDPTSLARALAHATRLLASRPPSAGPVTADQLPGWLDWVDTATLLAGLAAPPPSGIPSEPASAVPAPARSPRLAAAEAILDSLLSSGAVVPDPTRPVTTSVTLWAALVEQLPELEGAAWARDLVSRYVHRSLPGLRAATGPGGTSRWPSLASAWAAETPVAAADPAGLTWPQPAIDVQCAGIYLLLRTLDALRMPRLCERAGIPARDLLSRLACRWSAPATTAANIDTALHPLTSGTSANRDGPPAGAWQRLQVLASHAALAQLPDDADALHWSANADALAAVAHAHDAAPETDRALDLIALVVLWHWAWWLRGFAASPALSLLATFIRRPGRLTRTGDGHLSVTLTRKPHDVALEVSGALDPLDLTWPWPHAQPSGQPLVAQVRRIEFLLETG
jgi:hypothetical protein